MPPVFVGICVMAPPRRPWLVVQVNEETAQIYRLGLVRGEAAVILERGQDPSHLPQFMTEKECAAALVAEMHPQPEHAET